MSEQLKRTPNAELKAINDLFAAEWNPLVSNVKQKKASADRVVDLVNQLNSSLTTFNDKLKQNQETINGFSDQECALAEIKDREKLVESQLHEINALESLVQKLETIVSGPSISKLKREVENSREDWKSLLKDFKNMINKSQQKKDLQKRLDKCKESMENSLKMAKETSEKLEEDRCVNKLTKESLKKALADLESNRQWMNGDFNSLLKELQISGDYTSDELVQHENCLVDFNSKLDAIIATVNSLFGEIEKKYELSENFKKDLQNLNSDFRKKLNIELKPIARDESNLAEQKSQCANLINELDENGKMVDSLRNKWKDMCESGSISGMEMAVISSQLDALKEDISKQRTILTQRKRNISAMEQALLNNEHDMDAVSADISDHLADELLSEPIKAELNDLRNQQEKLRDFRERIRPLGQQVDRTVECCTNLMKNADSDTNIDSLDARKSSTMEAWNKLNSLVENREKQICMAMQELGGYMDTYNSLLIWLQDTEESLANQRAPSIEHKVVKEQSRANDILLKHIEEKQQSVSGFKEMIHKVEVLSSDSSQRQNLQEKCSDIEERYSALLKNAYIRRDRLHEALGLTATWSQAISPLKVWLKGAEWSLQQLAKVPTDEERIRQLIDTQNDLQEEIERKQPDFEMISELFPKILNLTSSEEGAELTETARGLMSRYEIISARVAECGELLQQMAEEIGTFFENANTLSEWLDGIEENIDKLGNISIYPEELLEQSALLTNLATSVTEHENLVSRVVDDGKDLCRETTGDEAIALQSNIETLRARYMELASITDSKIAILAEALPLSERFNDGCEILQQWMDAVEQDLHDIDQVPLEAQSALITQMEDDLGKWRLDVEEINSISKHLHRLTSGPRADELEAQTEDLSRRFTQLAEQVTRKAEKLMSVEKQSRQVLDELDYLNEWFTDAKSRLSKANAPAVDPDYVKKQLKNQKQMNEDIAIMKARLRDAIADAQKLSRALGDETGGQDSLLASKIESGRNLSQDVTKMGEERLGELEQALALCQEVDHSFGDLHIWLEKMEDEIDNCPPISTGNRRDHLLKQQTHNADLKRSIQAQKPLLDRFSKNVNALKELCDSDDGMQLEKIAEGVEERFEAIKETVAQRGEALETAIAHSSQFCDRLDVILTSLSAMASQVRNMEPVSADPERIRAQILENSSFLEELVHKEQALISIKDNATNLMGHAKQSDEHSSKDVALKLENLDNLWQELNLALESRRVILDEVLAKAESFWTELELCRKTADDFKQTIEEMQPATGQPQALEQQRVTLLAIEEQLSRIRPSLMEKLQKVGFELCDRLTAEELTHVEQQLNDVENRWANVSSAFSRKNADIVEAFENAQQFQTLFNELAKWLDDSEAKVAALMPMSGLSSSDIRNELNVLSDLRASLDDKAIQKEQLNQLSASLCAGAIGNQAALIRAPVNDLNSRWNRLYASLNERQQKIERALLEMGQFSQAYDQLTKWMEKTKNTLNEIDPCPTSLKQIEIEVCKHKVVQNDVLAHEGSIDTLNTAAKRIITNDPNSASVTQPMIDDLNAHWHTLVDKLEDVWEQLNEARKAAEDLGGEVDKWALWLQDKDADLSHVKPFGGLPETARAQLDDFLVLKAEIEQNRADLEAHLEMAEKYLSENATNNDTWIAQREAQLKKRWIQVQEKMVNREQKLRLAVADAEQLHSVMTEMNTWLGQAENRLGRLEPVSRIPETLELQISDHSTFQTEVTVHRELMTDVHSRGTKLQYYCEKKDAIPIKNMLVSAKHRFDKIVSRSADRGKQLDAAQQEAQLFFDSHTELMKWIESSTKWIDSQTVQTSSAERLREVLDKHRDFQRELASRQNSFDTTMKRGKLLSEHAPRGEQSVIDPFVEELRQSWTDLCTSSLLRQRDIEEALLASGQFDEALSSLREWLEKQLPMLKEGESQPIHGDFETISRLVEEHNNLKEQIESHRTNLETVRQRAEQILNQGKEDDSLEGLKGKLERLNQDWTQLESLAKLKDDRLKEALKAAEDFNNQMHTVLEWLPRAEARLRFKSSLSSGENEILEQLDEVVHVRKEFDDREEQVQSILESGRNILKNCHPEAEQPMKCCLKILETRWNEVSQLIDNKRDDLEKRLNELRDQERLISELLKFIAIKDSELKNLNNGPLPENIDALLRLMSDHDEFENSIRERQSEVDDATKSRKRITDEENKSKEGTKTAPKRQRSLRHPKCDQLSDRWKKLWIDSMEYGRRLREMREYLEEVKKLESFSFEEWRERYLDWTDSGKARISDLFRRIDKSGTGRVPRAAFIDGIIASKFPTSRLEMEKVADEFDKGDGMIDSKEFMARLRSDYAKKLPLKQKTDGEKINEEVVRQSEKCSCHTPYKIQKVGEGHYRFGDTQIKRMVRILRSTVMVRVGGGWVALDEFLHKHDPCRTKGRTNIDLQRAFYDDVRPEGAYDTMETFTKSSRSTPIRDLPLSSFTDTLFATRYSSTPGPITKIREKTERSMPMFLSRKTPNTSRNSPSVTQRSSRRPSDAQDSKIARPTTPMKSGSIIENMDSSRPDSRCSDISESAERPSRIPSLRGRKGSGYRPSSSRDGTINH